MGRTPIDTLREWVNGRRLHRFIIFAFFPLIDYTWFIEIDQPKFRCKERAKKLMNGKTSHFAFIKAAPFRPCNPVPPLS